MKTLLRSILLAAAASSLAAGSASADTFFVTGSGNNTVQRFSSNGTSLGSFPATNLNVPTAIAIDASGVLYVTDDQSSGTIEKYGSDGTDLGPFANANLVRPYGLAFDSAGNLYAANFGNGTIRKFSPAGADLGAFVTGLNGPVGLAFDGAGNLYVANYGNNTVTRYSSSGSALGTFASSGLYTPYALAFDAGGNLYVSNVASGHSSVEKFSPSGIDLGVFTTTGGLPTGLVFDTAGNLYVTSEQDNDIEIFSSTGSNLGVFASSPSGTSPAGIARLADGQTIQFTVSSYSVNENVGAATLTVNRSGAAAASVNFATSDGTAAAGLDYTAAAGTLTWTAGDTAPKTIQVPILDRGLAGAGTVSFSVLLSMPGAGSILGSPSQALVTIAQNDVAVAPAVTFSSPPTDLIVAAGSAVPLAVSVVDPSGVITRVQFLLDQTRIANLPAPGPYQAVATAPATPGNYTLSVTVANGQGLVYKSQRNLTVVAADPATPAPAAAIITDLNGRFFASGSEVPLVVSATAGPEGTSLTRVDFYADGVLFASSTDMNAPAPLDFAGRPVRRDASSDPVQAGSTFLATFQMPGSTKLVNILAVALDKLGRSQVSTPVAVQSVAGTADHPPSVSLGGLPDGTSVGVGFTVNLPVEVTDADPAVPSALGERGPRRRAFDASPLIVKVEYFLNSLKAKADEQSASSLSFTPAAEGTYVATVIATDKAGLATVSRPARLKAVTPVTVSLAAGGDGVGAEGGKKLKAVFSRTGSTAADLPVLYSLSGTATNKKDYLGTDGLPLPGFFLIPSGAASAKLKIVPKDDHKVEGTEKIKLKLLPSPEGLYMLGASAKAKLELDDND